MPPLSKEQPIGTILSASGIVPEAKAGMVTAQLQRGSGSFEWVSVATKPVLVGKFLDSVRGTPWLTPPRTAHLGGVWPMIMAGGAAELSLNNGIIRDNTGQLLIFDLNQLPSDDHKGDTLYHPEKMWDGQKYIDLPVSTWDGKHFENRGHEHPLFSPMVMTKWHGETIPLVQLHKQTLRALNPHAQFISDELVKHPSTRTALEAIVNQAELGDNPAEINHVLSLAFDRHVSKDGQVHSGGVISTRDGYRVGSTTYKNKDELVSGVMQVFELAAHPETLKNIQNIPENLPLISKESLVVLLALLDMDKSDRDPLRPVNTHVHWGAVSMAGIPPYVDGYFSGSASSVNQLTAITRAGLNQPENRSSPVPPIYYVLAPAAIYLAYPSQGEPYDMQAVNELMTRIADETLSVREKPNVLKQTVERVTSQWADESANKLSPAFRSRFSQHQSPLSTAIPRRPQLETPPALQDMTFPQAMYAIGALMSNLKNA